MIMSSSSSLNQVDTTLASAGTGKTTTLVRLLSEAIDNGVEPDQILATTFTTKAAAELIERTRSYLIENGKLEAATQLLGARLGTINSICGRLVDEFAFELGRPPSSEVIPEDSIRTIFAAAADETITGFAPTLNRLADAFGLPDQNVDWRGQVQRIIELARANTISPDDLRASAERSVKSLLELLPEPISGETEQDIDTLLESAIKKTVAAIDAVTLLSTTADAANAVRSAALILDRGGQLPWSLWAKLSKYKGPKTDAPYFAEVVNAALAHPRHPRLRRELEQFIRGVFECAAKSLSAYQAYKEERGLLDFVDQEALTLDILRRPDTQERLRDCIEIVFIDEVQDASPLQVAIFTELARIAPRSVWVGDPKQSIYAFRGTDPNLALAASKEIAVATGGTSGILSKSWRSRPGICDFVNDAFVPAFEAMGLPENSTRFTDCACDDAGLTVPALSVWDIEGNKQEQILSLAGGIVEALAAPDSWPVRSRSGPRNLQPGDIAVLCRSNADVEKVASALSSFGIPVAVDRGDLFKAPEVELTMAALRWTASSADRLALAEMARLIGGTTAPDAWLNAVVSDKPGEALKALVPFAPALEELRDQQLGMTPCELVDAVIVATGIIDMVCRWGNASDRLHILEAFRGVACSYEQECARVRSPATLAGLVSWLGEQSVSQPKSLDGNSVQVLTYHKAKGLEWPMVVLTQLDSKASADLFKPVVEIDGDVDWREPLARRWIRYWPWPYGKQATGVHLDASAPNSGIGQRATLQAKQEAVRVLYVGATRARDHLVLSTVVGKSGSRSVAWLEELNTGGVPHLVLPTDDGSPIRVRGQIHPARYRKVFKPNGVTPQDPEPLFLSTERSRQNWRPLRLQPSAASAGTAFVSSGRVELGGRIPITGAPEMDVLGQAMHAFLAVDRRDTERSVRLAKARFVLDRWSVIGHVAPEDLLIAADRLRAFVDQRFPGARIRREVPVYALQGPQVITGRIDLLVEGDSDFAIIDHKSFPGRESLWDDKAVAYAPQLDLYARAVATATGKTCSGLFVHMPIVGTVVEVQGKEELVVAPSAG
jgi:ATP-dependent exoDNAse (exonuclease V) beta subunit